MPLVLAAFALLLLLALFFLGVPLSLVRAAGALILRYTLTDWERILRRLLRHAA